MIVLSVDYHITSDNITRAVEVKVFVHPFVDLDEVDRLLESNTVKNAMVRLWICLFSVLVLHYF